MKYADVINPNIEIYSEYYSFRRSFFDYSFFVCFIPKHWNNKHPKSLGTNWKARLSIHPEDFDKAWDVIYPILYENGVVFKVANRNIFEKAISRRNKRLDYWCSKFIINHDMNKLDLKYTYSELSQRLAESNYSKWRLVSLMQNYYTKLSSFLAGLFLNKDNLFALFKQKNEQRIEQVKQSITKSIRMYEGMQFTIYIVPGLEHQHQQMLNEIESLLITQNIRAGIIYPTDRQIGIYSSIRHPGVKIYHEAINVDGYNPDGVYDPFNFLDTLAGEQIIREQDCQKILSNQWESTQNIINTLTTKKLISPAALKILAEHKEVVVDYIKTQACEVRKKLINDSLNKSTNLGAFFKVQRGVCKPKLGRGALGQIEQLAYDLGSRN